MSSNRFLTLINGIQTFVEAIAVSAGVADANKVIRTGADGRVSSTMMPVGIGAETVSMPALEALAAGDWVNITSTGARKADNSNSRPCNGFVLDAVANAATAIVYTDGANTANTGLTPGALYWLGSAGAETTTPPSTTAGSIVQSLGIATTTTTIAFGYSAPISVV